MARLPGPPLLGATMAPALFRRPHLALADLHRRYGTVAAIGAGPTRDVALFGPEANRLLLSDRPESFLWVDLAPRSTDVEGGGVSALRPVGGLHAAVDAVR